MLQPAARASLLIVWLVFLGFVTLLDWLGLFCVLFIAFPSWFSWGAFYLGVIVLLFWLRTILCSEELSRFRRVMLALGIIWLLVLPSIRWGALKPLIMDYTRLQVGSSKAQVKTIMAAHKGGASGDSDHLFYYSRADCPSDDCPRDVTRVNVDFMDDRVISTGIELD